MDFSKRMCAAKSAGLNPIFTVSVQLTALQYDRILQLVMMMGLDPDKDFNRIAQQVICESLDLRIESNLAELGAL